VNPFHQSWAIVGGLLDSTAFSKAGSGTLATQTAVLRWRSEMPAAFAASRWEVVRAPSLPKFRVDPSYCLSSSPSRRTARLWMRSARLRSVSSSMALNASVDSEGALLARRQKSACRADIIDRRDSAAGHHHVDRTEPAR